jgi:hypothetical protein
MPLGSNDFFFFVQCRCGGFRARCDDGSECAHADHDERCSGEFNLLPACAFRGRLARSVSDRAPATLPFHRPLLSFVVFVNDRFLRCAP